MTIQDLITKFCSDLEVAIRKDAEERVRAAFGAPRPIAKAATKVAPMAAPKKRAKPRARFSPQQLGEMIAGHIGDLAGEPTTRERAMRSLMLSKSQWETGINYAIAKGLARRTGINKGASYLLPERGQWVKR